MQNSTYIQDVQNMAQKYVTPGGPDDLDDNNNNDDEKKISSPPSNLQQDEFDFGKYSVTELQTKFQQIFDQHFDQHQNGDVDITDFKNSVLKLGSSVSDPRISKIFNYILSTDNDGDDTYIDKVQFSDFLLARYSSPQLKGYQQDLINLIRDLIENTKISSITSSKDTHENEENAMRRHLALMIEKELYQQQNDAVFQEELLKRKTMNDNLFCLTLNALSWSEYEVCYWVGSVNNKIFHYIMKKFVDLKINGEMLLYDVDDKLLLQRIGLKQIHLKTFTRLLKDLRKIALNSDNSDKSDKNTKNTKIITKVENVSKKKSVKILNKLSFDMFTMIDIPSFTEHLLTRNKIEIERIKLNATKNESALYSEKRELQKQIDILTTSKYNINKELNQFKNELFLCKIKLNNKNIEINKLKKENELNIQSSTELVETLLSHQNTNFINVNDVPLSPMGINNSDNDDNKDDETKTRRRSFTKHQFKKQMQDNMLSGDDDYDDDSDGGPLILE